MHPSRDLGEDAGAFMEPSERRPARERAKTDAKIVKIVLAKAERN